MRVSSKSAVTLCGLTLLLGGCQGPGAGGADDVESVRSALTGPPPVVGGARIACGGPAVPPFLADSNSDGAGAIKTRAVTVTTLGVTDAGPAALYQSQRYQNAPNGTMTYTFSGFGPQTPVNFKLHFAETNPANNHVGAREFNVAVNGTTFLTAFDIFAKAGMNKAIVEGSVTLADAQGKVAITFTQIPGHDAATISGIEAYADGTAAGAWTAKNAPTRYPGGDAALQHGSTVTFAAGAQPQLLTDGTVLLGDGSLDGTAWFKLTPDTSGSYENGTWTQVASSNLAREYFPSTMLNTGKYMIAGGEDVVGDPNHSSVEVYDPVADTWSLRAKSFTDPGGIGDTASSILGDGHVLMSSFQSPNTYTYDANSDVFKFVSKIGTTAFFQTGDEKGWTLLQTGELFDIFGDWSLFEPSTLTWTAPQPLPAGMSLVSLFASNEVGPASLLYDGRVMQFGSASDMTGLGIQAQTAIFDPKTKTVVPGPNPPDKLQWGDTSAAVLITGHVLNVTSTSIESGPNVKSIWEWDPGQPIDDAFTKVATQGTDLAAPQRLPSMAFPVFLQLPNGQVMDVEANDSQVHFYAPYNGQNLVSPAWRPTITSVSAPTAGEFTLTGTQLNGLTTGATFGDDRNSGTNFPIVWLQDFQTPPQKIYYARTYGFSSMTPEPTATHTCKFVLPSGIPNGSYLLKTSANGVASSNSVPINITGNHLLYVTGITVGPGQTAGWSVKLSGTSTSPTNVTISSDNTGVALPLQTTVTIPAGQTVGTFSVEGIAAGIAHITAKLAQPNAQFQPVVATFGAVVQSVRPTTGEPRPQHLGPSPKAAMQTWTVTISNFAPLNGGMVVNLATSNPSISIPSSVTIPPSSHSATFTVKRAHPSPSAPRPILPTLTGTITASMAGSSKSFPIAIRSRGDVNGDGLSDITLAGGEDFTAIPLALSNGDGTFRMGALAGEVTGDTSFVSSAKIQGAKVLDGDFDDDGLSDVALIGTDALFMPVAFAQGDGTYRGTRAQVIPYPGSAIPNPNFMGQAELLTAQPLSGDFNGDGSVDIALTGSSTFAGIPVAFSLSANYDRHDRQNLSGQFAATMGGITSAPSGVNFPALAAGANIDAVAGDFDGDGRTDIALLGTPSAIQVALSNGDGNFHVPNVTHTNGESGFQTLHVIEGAKGVVGDFNGDGRSDIALVIGMSTTSIAVALSNGDGSFTVSLNAPSATSQDPNFATYSTLEGARVAAGDFDGDGFDDIAVTGGVGWGSIPVAFSNGDGTFKTVNLGGTQATQFYGLANDFGASPSTTPMTDRIVDTGRTVYDTSTQCTIGGATMHCCPSGFAMTGIHADRNTLRCAALMNPTGTLSVDTTTLRNSMHACPFGTVMIGINIALDQFGCQAIPGNPITKEDVDNNSADGFPMHVCNDTRFAAMSGLTIARNQLTCTVGN